MRCKHCKTKFEPKQFLQKFCMQTDECISSAIAFTKAQKEKEWKKSCQKERKEYYEKNRKLSDYEADAKKVYQAWIRKRDENLPCISCGKTTDNCWQGSHYFDANRFSGLIFDERNCHKSCEQCNKFHHGNLIGYRIGLVSRYGEEFVKTIENESDAKRKYKYTREELTEIKNKYTKLLKL
jgi:hypothetical protein